MQKTLSQISSFIKKPDMIMNKIQQQTTDDDWDETGKMLNMDYTNRVK